MYIGVAANNLLDAQTYMDALMLKQIGAKLYTTKNKQDLFIILIHKYTPVFADIQDLYSYLENRTKKKLIILPNNLESIDLDQCIRFIPARA